VCSTGVVCIIEGVVCWPAALVCQANFRQTLPITADNKGTNMCLDLRLLGSDDYFVVDRGQRCDRSRVGRVGRRN